MAHRMRHLVISNRYNAHIMRLPGAYSGAVGRKLRRYTRHCQVVGAFDAPSAAPVRRESAPCITIRYDSCQRLAQRPWRRAAGRHMVQHVALNIADRQDKKAFFHPHDRPRPHRDQSRRQPSQPGHGLSKRRDAGSTIGAFRAVLDKGQRLGRPGETPMVDGGSRAKGQERHQQRKNVSTSLSIFDGIDMRGINL